MQATAPVRSAELQAQVLAAVTALAALGLADEQDLVDLATVAELVQEHALKLEMVADRTNDRSLHGRRTRRAATPAETGHRGDAHDLSRAPSERVDDAQAPAIPLQARIG